MNELAITIPNSKPLPPLPQSATIAEITARAKTLREVEVAGVWGLTESRLALGQALTLAREKLTAKQFAEWLDDVGIPTEMWRAYSAFWARRDTVRAQLTDNLNGQKMLPGIAPAALVDSEEDVIERAAERGEVGGVDFSEAKSLVGELMLRERNVVAQCREHRRFLETLAKKVVAGEAPSSAEAEKLRLIRASLHA